MNHSLIDRLNRRSSFAALRAASLATLSASMTAEAKKSKTKKKARKKCRSQVRPCIDFLDQEFCFFTSDPPKCLAEVEECCAPAANCDSGAVLTCLLFLCDQQGVECT